MPAAACRPSRCKPVHVLPCDRSHLELAKLGPDVLLDDRFEPAARGWTVLPLNVIGDVAIEQVIDRRRRTERLPLAGRSPPSAATACRNRRAFERALSTVILPCSPMVNHREWPCLLR